MKQQLNEVQKLQKVAGILKEDDQQIESTGPSIANEGKKIPFEKKKREYQKKIWDIIVDMDKTTDWKSTQIIQFFQEFVDELSL
jgi:hypothetical protein